MINCNILYVAFVQITSSSCKHLAAHVHNSRTWVRDSMTSLIDTTKISYKAKNRKCVFLDIQFKIRLVGNKLYIFVKLDWAEDFLSYFYVLLWGQ